MNIYEKVQKAKEMILVANIKKSGRNNFANYTYYELADLLPHIISICNELKLFTKVDFTSEYATLEIINIEEPSEKIEYKSPMKDLQLKGANAIQALGGAETYQRRYLYMSAFDIIENDMFDGSDPKLNEPDNTPKQETISKMNKLVTEFAKKLGKDENVVKRMVINKIGVKVGTQLTEDQVKKINKLIESQLNK